VVIAEHIVIANFSYEVQRNLHSDDFGKRFQVHELYEPIKGHSWSVASGDYHFGQLRGGLVWHSGENKGAIKLDAICSRAPKVFELQPHPTVPIKDIAHREIDLGTIKQYVSSFSCFECFLGKLSSSLGCGIAFFSCKSLNQSSDSDPQGDEGQNSVNT